MNIEMMNGLNFIDYKTGEKYKVYLNGAWLKITHNNSIVVKREPENNNWYDEKHAKLMQAKYAFEQAIEDMLI